jgi:hypothetical protein
VNKKKAEESEKKERAGRYYKASLLPIFRGGVIDLQSKRDDLKWLYGEVCSSWRMLTDVRFKLLGLVPTISVVALISVLSRAETNAGLSPEARMGIIVFGFLVTFGLFIYDRRNSQLYNDLVSRARRIEEELGIDTGQFRGRKDPSNWLINHSNATNLIYGTTLAGWLFALLATWLHWA